MDTYLWDPLVDELLLASSSNATSSRTGSNHREVNSGKTLLDTVDRSKVDKRDALSLGNQFCEVYREVYQ